VTQHYFSQRPHAKEFELGIEAFLEHVHFRKRHFYPLDSTKSLNYVECSWIFARYRGINSLHGEIVDPKVSSSDDGRGAVVVGYRFSSATESVSLSRKEVKPFANAR
jgi:hypothetical protein